MSKLILIIEDNEKNMKLFRDILQVNNYQTAESTDGKSGLENARKLLPDLILLDIMLPIMNGFDVARALKDDPKTKKIIVIAISSFAMDGDREKALNAGCDDYITKPIDVRTCIKKINEHLIPQNPSNQESTKAA